MALVHEKLYQSDNLARVDFRDYLQHLVATVFDSYNPRRSTIRLTVDVIEIALGIDTAIPCGLLINEIVSNALKHAFPDKRSGEVRIGLKEIESEKLELVIENDGVDFPDNVDFRNANSLGLQLVSSLVNQIGGVIEMRRLQPGTQFTIRFAK
jgi:two-component sensor histidine kinase